jgi:hypothetical protein
MRSLSFQNKYIYFSEIKQIVGLVVEIHKYVEMLEKLHQSEEISVEESMYHHHTNKYQNNEQIGRRESSSSSIIDQFNELKIDLKKEIYHKSDTKQK